MDSKEFDGISIFRDVWVIVCRTGCTCCASDNFTEGPYLTEAEAQKVKADYSAGKGNPLASQYAKHGVYSIEKWNIEVLKDGRWIYEHNIFSSGFHVRPLLDSNYAVLD